MLANRRVSFTGSPVPRFSGPSPPPSAFPKLCGKVVVGAGAGAAGYARRHNAGHDDGGCNQFSCRCCGSKQVYGHEPCSDAAALFLCDLIGINQPLPSSDCWKRTRPDLQNNTCMQIIRSTNSIKVINPPPCAAALHDVPAHYQHRIQKTRF